MEDEATMTAVQGGDLDHGRVHPEVALALEDLSLFLHHHVHTAAEAHEAHAVHAAAGDQVDNDGEGVHRGLEVQEDGVEAVGDADGVGRDDASGLEGDGKVVRLQVVGVDSCVRVCRTREKIHKTVESLDQQAWDLSKSIHGPTPLQP